MICEHDYPQRSEEWFSVRLGKITGSKFCQIMPTKTQKTEWSRGQLTLLKEIALIRLTGYQEETFQSSAMEWGVEQEKYAIEAYSKQSGNIVSECGFFVDSTIPMAGSSPDGIFDHNTLEVKCPMSKTHLSYIIDPEKLWETYKWQCIGESLFAEKDNCVICSYDPSFPEGKQLVVIKKDNLEEDKAALRARLLSANELIDSWIK